MELVWANLVFDCMIARGKQILRVGLVLSEQRLAIETNPHLQGDHNSNQP